MVQEAPSRDPIFIQQLFIRPFEKYFNPKRNRCSCFLYCFFCSLYHQNACGRDSTFFLYCLWGLRIFLLWVHERPVSMLMMPSDVSQASGPAPPRVLHVADAQGPAAHWREGSGAADNAWAISWVLQDTTGRERLDQSGLARRLVVAFLPVLLLALSAAVAHDLAARAHERRGRLAHAAFQSGLTTRQQILLVTIARERA